MKRRRRLSNIGRSGGPCLSRKPPAGIDRFSPANHCDTVQLPAGVGRQASALPTIGLETPASEIRVDPAPIGVY